MRDLSSRRKTIIIAVFNIFVFILFVIFCGVRYSMDDEKFFSLSIAFGDYNIIFTNYFLCRLIGFIQHMIYPINAFTAVSLMFAVLAFITLHSIFARKISLKWSFLVMIFLYAFFGVNHLTIISYTMLPALLAVAGLFYIIDGLDAKFRMRNALWGVFLTVIASMYRFKVFLSCFCVIAVFYLVRYLIGYRKSEKNLLSYVKKLFTKQFSFTLVTVVLLVFSFNFASQIINTSTPELSYYKQYTTLRSQVWDFEMPSYEEAKSEYDSLNITENDLKMLKNIYLDDGGAFTVDTLTELVEIRKAHIDNRNIFSSFIDMSKSLILETLSFSTDKSILFVSFLLIMLLFLLIMKKRYYFIPISLLVVMAGLNFYLWQYARTPYRAIYGIVFPCVVSILYSVEKSGFKKKALRFFDNNIFYSSVAIVCIAVISFIVPVTLSKSYSIDTQIKKVSGHDQVVNYIESQNDKRFVVANCINVSNNYNLQRPWTVKIPDVPENAAQFLGTYYRSTYDNHLLEKFGTKDVYTFLINNDSAYFVDTVEVNVYKMFETYLNDHYSNGKNIKLVLNKSIGDYRFYSVKEN